MGTRQRQGRPIEILLVEDNPSSVDLTREALRACQIPCHLNVARDGLEALAFLQGRENHLTAPCPDLIFLDLNLPRKDGRQVLAEIKADESLRHVPVVVLTSSSARKDVREVYNLHANCYLVKPMALVDFFSMIHSTVAFWGDTVELPGSGSDER